MGLPQHAFVTSLGFPQGGSSRQPEKGARRLLQGMLLGGLLLLGGGAGAADRVVWENKSNYDVQIHASTKDDPHRGYLEFFKADTGSTGRQILIRDELKAMFDGTDEDLAMQKLMSNKFILPRKSVVYVEYLHNPRGLVEQTIFVQKDDRSPRIKVTLDAPEDRNGQRSPVGITVKDPEGKDAALAKKDRGGIQVVTLGTPTSKKEVKALSFDFDNTVSTLTSVTDDSFTAPPDGRARH